MDLKSLKMCQDKNTSKVSYIEKTGSAMRNKFSSRKRIKVNLL